MNTRLIQHDKNADEIDRLLSELAPGYKVAIKRITPLFCDGNLTTLEADPDEPISLEYIRERFGGRKLNVKITDQNNVYVASKTVSFPDPPRDNGVELIELPNGQPIRKDRLEEKKEIQRQEDQRLQAPPVQNDSLALIQHLLTLQSEQNKSTQTLLKDRIESLEKILETRRGQGEARDQGEAGGGGTLFDGVRDTIRAIKEVETLRAAMVMNSPNAAPPSEGFAAWQPSIEKLIDFGLEMQRAKIESQAQAQQVPALPRPQAPRLLPVEELINQVQTRLQGVDPETKRQIIAQVMGEELDDDDDDEIDDDEADENEDSNDNQDPADRSCDDSNQGVELNLLSDTDRAILGNDGRNPKRS